MTDLNCTFSSKTFLLSVNRLKMPGVKYQLLIRLGLKGSSGHRELQTGRLSAACGLGSPSSVTGRAVSWGQFSQPQDRLGWGAGARRTPILPAPRGTQAGAPAHPLPEDQSWALRSLRRHGMLDTMQRSCDKGLIFLCKSSSYICL